MVTDFEHFKRAFLVNCKAAGMSSSEINGCVDSLLARIKSAGLDSFTSWIPGYPVAESFAKSVADKAPAAAIGAYVGLPLAAGFGAGAGIASLQDTSDEDPSEVRTRESIDSYRNLTRQMAIKDRLRLLNRPTRARSPLVR